MIKRKAKTPKTKTSRETLTNLRVTSEILIEHHYSAWDHFLNRLVFIVYPSVRNKYSKSKLSIWGKLYDLMLFIAVVSSLTSLAIDTKSLAANVKFQLFFFIEVIPFIIFAIDFTLKWMCSKHYYKATKRIYFLFPLTFQGIYLTISIIPSLSIIFLVASNTYLFDIFNSLTFFRIIRIFDIFLAAKSFFLILNSVRSCWRQIALFMITILLLSVSLALIFYQVEKNHTTGSTDDINTFAHALYYTFIIMTTVGLGDKITHTPIGNFTTVISALLGIMLYSVPSGMFTAAMMVELRELKKQGSQEAYIYHVTSLGNTGNSKFRTKLRKLYGIHEK